MAKVTCPLMMCEFNGSFEKEQPGICLNDENVELYVKNIQEIDGFETGVPDELEDECLMKCRNFTFSKIKRKLLNEEFKGGIR